MERLFSPQRSDAKLIAFRIEAHLNEALRKSAQENGRTVSAEIRHALRQYLTVQEEEVAA